MIYTSYNETPTTKGKTMFKKPLQVQIDTADTIAVEHKVTVHPLIAFQADQLIKTAGKTLMTVIVVAAIAKTGSSVTTHLVTTLVK